MDSSVDRACKLVFLRLGAEDHLIESLLRDLIRIDIETAEEAFNPAISFRHIALKSLPEKLVEFIL